MEHVDFHLNAFFDAGIAPKIRACLDCSSLVRAVSFRAGYVEAIAAAELVGARCDDTMSAFQDVLTRRRRIEARIVIGRNLNSRIGDCLLDDL